MGKLEQSLDKGLVLKARFGSYPCRNFENKYECQAEACEREESQEGNLLKVKLEKTPAFGLPVTTKPNKQ